MTLFVIRAELLTDRLMNIGLRKKLPMHEVDTGYLVHCQLVELFGDLAPKPFVVDQARGRKVVVFGYSDHDAAELRAFAESHADEATRSACILPELADQPRPAERWRAGQRMGFRARVCPVVRRSKPGPGGRDKGGKPLEVDAYLAASWRRDEKANPLDRERVYREWLERQLENLGGAKIVDARMTSFKLDRVARRTQGEDRRAPQITRPDVTFEGTLEVTDPVKFDALLRRGIGRHRAFGFGMLLLRSVS